MTRRLRVVRLGGSLLDLADIAKRIRDWIAQQSDAVNLLIVGGGTMVDVVREMDRIHRLEAASSHRLALMSMRISAQLVAELLPEAILVNNLSGLLPPSIGDHQNGILECTPLPHTGSPTNLQTALMASQNTDAGYFVENAGLDSDIPDSLENTAKLIVLDVWEFLQNNRARTALPASWDVTSDSIAAYVASVLQADELILLKSCLPDGDSHMRDLAEVGYVDRYFPKAGQNIRHIRCVNLRAEGFPQKENSLNQIDVIQAEKKLDSDLKLRTPLTNSAVQSPSS